LSSTPPRAYEDPELDAAIGARQPEGLTRLLEFIRIPSVSALPQHKQDCRAAAEWLLAEFQRAGAESAQLDETDSNPVVSARFAGRTGSKNVLVYGHYDVQPVGDESLWESDPFDARLEGNKILGRGSADDKGQLHAYIAALEALRDVDGQLPVNLLFVVDGDEEFESIHLDNWVADHRDDITSDVVMISDTSFFAGNLPSIPVSLRGVSCMQVDIYGPRQELHSGIFGGSAPNPVNVLCNLIAGMTNDSGAVSVEGFYDGIPPLEDSERGYMASLPFDQDQWCEEIGVSAPLGEDGYSTVERTTVRPTFDLNGIWGGFIDEGVKTIIPASAHAKINCRLLPGQVPSEIVAKIERHLLAHAPVGVTIEVKDLASDVPFWVNRDDPYVAAARDAMAYAFKQDVLLPRYGGSIPVAATFDQALGVPTVLFGFQSPDCGAHAPNEFLFLDNYSNAVRAITRYFRHLGDGLVGTSKPVTG
jgi:acetylornithine deacetylase/succinyl-diaminopimelate desuccinylase-like protein